MCAIYLMSTISSLKTRENAWHGARWMHVPSPVSSPQNKAKKIEQLLGHFQVSLLISRHTVRTVQQEIPLIQSTIKLGLGSVQVLYKRVWGMGGLTRNAYLA